MELIRVQDSDYRKTYELYMSFPENENGYMNNVYGYDYEQFLEWIEKSATGPWEKSCRRGLYLILLMCWLMVIHMLEFSICAIV
ncbi:hypothetical protein [Butyrivibrio sp. INlla14]|uniref:hypothetical protein n=1 Tax=Butyrivibrio sp. INlla14 TaxID=1520808 RepID=UPI0008767625|nr:hypothetical protein [Butyrivibrio sp. INlla14]SCX89146.1 hypothetical protein SAMN02910371_00302 [Butyrivibrio sp. INlla14]